MSESCYKYSKIDAKGKPLAIQDNSSGQAFLAVTLSK